MTYKKPTTSAEKDAAREASQAITAELIQRIDQRIDVLADQLAKGASDDLLAFMRFSAKFPTYSLNNQISLHT